jgi:hypothetical protein
VIFLNRLRVPGFSTGDRRSVAGGEVGYENVAFPKYEPRAPSAQNCIDAVPGWNSKFPDETGVIAGNRIHFQDDRILWALDRFGPVEGAKVLEIGPMEGAHTYLLDQRGADVTAVEANKQAFLKCLITKEVMRISRARFLLGDCVHFLERNEDRYDLIVACGVLYHMPDPLRFLDAIAARTDSLYLWTSYLDPSPLAPGDPRVAHLDRTREIREYRGISVTLYRRDYATAHLNEDFCGGIYNAPRWMERKSILEALTALGFDSLEIAHEERMAEIEPSFSIFAKRA